MQAGTSSQAPKPESRNAQDAAAATAMIRAEALRSIATKVAITPMYGSAGIRCRRFSA